MSDDWQPIEIAPHTVDVEILVCSCWEAKPGVIFYNCDVVSWVDWDDRSGWWNGDVCQEPDYFTHWQPLPERPKLKL